MANLNKVNLIGTLVKGIELKYVPSGTAVAELDIAINSKRKDGDNWVDEVTYVNGITVWAAKAESCAKFLRKGSQVFIEGKLKLESWEQDGKKRSKLKVVADNVQFLSNYGKEGEQSRGQAPSQQQSHQQQSFQDNRATNSGSTFNDNEPPF